MKRFDHRMRSIVQPVVTVLLVGLCMGPSVAARARPQERVNPDAAAIADFMKRVEGYVALHDKIDAMLPEPTRDGRPEAVVEHQRAFAKLMQQERASAQPGDIVTKPMRHIIRRLLASIFRGPNGREIKHSILDEFPGNVMLRINQPYPDNLPFASVPLPILQGLPKLPEALVYRFVGPRLILLDPHGRLVIDLVEKVFP